MTGFVAELARVSFTAGYPYEPEYTTIHPLEGEFPHRVRLELHGIPGFLPNLEAEGAGGSHEHACQEAAYSLMTTLRARHDLTFRHSAYRYHPGRGPNSMVSRFRSARSEQDPTFGRMCTVLQGLDQMHHDLHEASKALNDAKLTQIVRLQDEVDRLKKENARLKGLPEPGGARCRTTARKRTRGPPRVQSYPGAPDEPGPLMQMVPTSPTPVPEEGVSPFNAARNRNRVVTVSSSSESASGEDEDGLPSNSRSRSEDEEEDPSPVVDRRSPSVP
uniref:Retrotransposon protein-like n=1 Tax=Oryza brachyantha TaxID=4533 RepID=D3XNQ7_ORYBR|nr:unknown [Oryza brachyantha]